MSRDTTDIANELLAENAALKAQLSQRDTQIAALTADNWSMRDVMRQLIKGRPGGCYFIKWEPLILNALNETTATAADANALRAEGAEAVAAYHKERIDALSDVHRRGANDHKVAYMAAMDVAHQLREGK